MKPGLLGRFLYYVLPIRRGVVLGNIALALGDVLDAGERKILAQMFYRHIALTLLENLILGFYSLNRIRDMVEVRGIEHLMAAAGQKKGILILTGHFGNWELLPMAGILHYPDFKGRLHVLRRQIVNKAVERLLFRRFYKMGLDVIPKRHSLPRVMQLLAQNDTVAFIMDQYARPGREGIVASFCGHPAGTFRSLAMVARSSEAPVLPVAGWRESGGRHIVEFGPPLDWIKDEDPDQEILRNTEAYNQMIETVIRRHPDQWLWIHKRWKIKK
ncbi:MAG: lysophospholipid acyltransferase family protein [Candidatus Omnitrophica bacterium]|nr:lysophospholipid acyltransferase family protein [Candidatus Omnitrophota bacterium]